MKITILHDTTNSFGRLEPRHEEVYSYDLPDELEQVPADVLLEDAFLLFNVGTPEESEIVRGYREKKLRSLSVGDQVRIGDDTYLVKSFGWERV